MDFTFDIIGCGPSFIDEFHMVQAFPPRGGQTYIMESFKSSGGSSANVIYGMARLGFRSSFVSMVGNDREGKRFISDFKKVGVDTSQLLQSPHSTGRVFCYVDREGERTFFTISGANDDLVFENLDLGHLMSGKIIHFCPFNTDAGYDAQVAIARSARKKGIKISLDPGYAYAAKGIQGIKDLLKETDFFFPNYEEFSLLTGVSPKEGVKDLLRLGIRVLCIKLGKQGVAAYTADGKEYSVPAKYIAARDTTGAGDAFDCGFLAGHLRGYSTIDCLKSGIKVASYVIQKIGARAYPAKLEI